jgi:hypothetical protein
MDFAKPLNMMVAVRLASSRAVEFYFYIWGISALDSFSWFGNMLQECKTDCQVDRVCSCQSVFVIVELFLARNSLEFLPKYTIHERKFHPK